jgi:hypothetical protein
MNPLAIGQAKQGTVCNTATGSHPFSLSIKIKRAKRERDI